MKFKLFICGDNSSSNLAVQNARRLMNGLSGNRHELEIIDVLENPERAEECRILATPTLIKEHPAPMRMLVGDLSDLERVRTILQLPADMKLAENERRSK
jgi:circadian clock protein KaiB